MTFAVVEAESEKASLLFELCVLPFVCTDDLFSFPSEITVLIVLLPLAAAADRVTDPESLSVRRHNSTNLRKQFTKKL